MKRKTDTVNLGLPVFANPKKDLIGKPNVFTDSWYVLCNFQHEGREIGFEWHQAIFTERGQKVSATEFLLMDASRQIWLDNAINEPVSSKAGADFEHCSVTSAFGTLQGNERELHLKAETEKGAIDVVLRPQQQIMYNGTVGVLPLWGSQSFQFAYPNMTITGTIRLHDEMIKIQETTAWLDRQWTYPNPENRGFDFLGSLPSWLWLGMTLTPDSQSAISLWDVCYGNGERYTFATLLDKNGNQNNHIAYLTYRNIWASERTGNSYPAELYIKIPTANIELTLTAMLERPEFSHGNDGEVNINGCQSPCQVRGHYGDTPVQRMVILEMIGDVCGELKS